MSNDAAVPADVTGELIAVVAPPPMASPEQPAPAEPAEPAPADAPPSTAPSTSASPAPADTGETMRLEWAHPPGLVGLSFKNFLLKIVTLGLYQFWGKTEVRKRIWSAIRINGEPLHYTGTGKELLIGFLVVLAVVTVPSLLVTLASALLFGDNQIADATINIAMTFGVFYLIGVGMHRAVRYRMSRTTWRGIRGGLEGSSWHYGWTYFWTGPGLFGLAAALWIWVALAIAWSSPGGIQTSTGAMLAMAISASGLAVIAAVLSWIMPWRATKLQGLITNGMRFGNRAFHFDAKPGPLYGPFLALWLSAIAIMMVIALALWMLLRNSGIEVLLPTPERKADPVLVFKVVATVYLVTFVGFLMFAVMSAWYRAQVMNHFAAHTTFEDARFQGLATGGSLIWLAVSNMLLVLFTLGLLAPVAQARSARYFVERLRLEGTARLADILQRAEDDSSRGEGLAQAFDIDAF